MIAISVLLDNALKYLVPGRKPEIVVSARAEGGEWRKEVRDKGVGLLPDQEVRLFRVFERLQPRSRYPGTGIGLALCRKIGEHHRGRMGGIAGRKPGLHLRRRFPPLFPRYSGGHDRRQ